MWYHQHIGGERCPVVDTWWQTETGHIMITPLPGITTLKPGSATRPFPGIAPRSATSSGERVDGGRRPARAHEAVAGDAARHLRRSRALRAAVLEQVDRRRLLHRRRRASVDDDGYFWLLGRVDDVLNVAGHRIGTMEVESALVDHPKVAEAAVVGRPHEIKGQAVAAFVTLKEGTHATPELVDELKEHVVKKIGAIARPDEILFAADLPKTRSGKIMRRLLRDIAEGKALGDTTTLADPAVVARLKEQYEDEAVERIGRSRGQTVLAASKLGESRIWPGASPTVETRMALIETRDLWKTYVMGDEEIHALRGVSISDRARRVRRDHGAVRLRQVDADEPDRLPRHADQGQLPAERQAGQPDERQRAGAHPERGDRVRLPDVQPAAARDGAAQRRAAAGLRRRAGEGPAGAREAGARQGRARRRA